MGPSVLSEESFNNVEQAVARVAPMGAPHRANRYSAGRKQHRAQWRLRSASRAIIKCGRGNRRQDPRGKNITAVSCIVFIICLISVSNAYADNSIVLRTLYPVEGERTELYVQDDKGNSVFGAEITATYRPGSSVENTSPVGITGRSGRMTWIPSAAGIVTLSATWESAAGDTVTTTTNVSVRFRSTPAGGLLIMLLAGLLLVGGSAVRILSVIRSGQ